MNKERSLKKLQTLWNNVGIAAQVDAVVMQELRTIEEGTTLLFSVEDDNWSTALAIRKKDNRFIPIETHQIESTDPQIRILFPVRLYLYNLLRGNRGLSEMIAQGEVLVQGANPLVMTIIRLIQKSLPYLFTLRKTHQLLPLLPVPQQYRKKKIIFHLKSIFLGGKSV